MPWKNLIRDWLRRTAEQRLREAMAAAGQSERPGASAATTTQPVLAGILSAHVGLVLPEHREAVGLIDRLDGLLKISADRVEVFEGGLHGRRLAVVICGRSAAAAAEATEALIDGHSPQWILAAGFCTGLVADLSVEELVLASQVISADGELTAFAPPSASMRTGRLLSTMADSRDVEDRKLLVEKYAAVAADSHSYAVVDTALRRGLPCAALCVVRHAVAQAKPQDLDRLRRKQSLSRRVGLLTGLLLSRPGSLKTILGEKEQDLIAADCLADGIEALIQMQPFRHAPHEVITCAQDETVEVKEDQ